MGVWEFSPLPFARLSDLRLQCHPLLFQLRLAKLGVNFAKGPNSFRIGWIGWVPVAEVAIWPDGERVEAKKQRGGNLPTDIRPLAATNHPESILRTQSNDFLGLLDIGKLFFFFHIYMLEYWGFPQNLGKGEHKNSENYGLLLN